jgi:hypothetical protein
VLELTVLLVQLRLEFERAVVEPNLENAVREAASRVRDVNLVAMRELAVAEPVRLNGLTSRRWM